MRVCLRPVPAGRYTSFLGVFIPHAFFVDKQRVMFAVAEDNKLVAPLLAVQVVPLEGDAILNKPASISITDLHDSFSVGLLFDTLLFRQNRRNILNNFQDYSVSPS